MRIGFDFFLDETPLFFEIAKELKDKYNVEITGVTLGKRWSRILDKRFTYFNLSDYLQQNWDRFDITPASLRKYEKLYPDIPFNNIIYSDKYCVKSVTGRKFNLEDIRKLLVGHICFWEDYFDATQAGAFIGPGIQGMFDRTRLEVMKKRGCVNLSIFSTRLPNGRFVFCRNDQDRWDSVLKTFLHFQKNGFPETERVKARQWHSSYLEYHDVPDYMKIKWKKIGLTPSFIFEFVRRLQRYYIEGWGRDFDYITPSPFRSLYSKGIRKIISANYTLRTNIFEQPVDGENFIFFPLHYQPEASTMVLAPYFEDQLSLIEYIAKSIPLDCVLYVKEHSSCLGLRPIGFYKRIKRLPNVRLIHPLADTPKLIRGSQVNVVITSTVGWESLLLGKRPIVLGNVFYNYSGLTLRVTDLTTLAENIEVATKNKSVDEETLLMFISSLFHGSYEGIFAVPHHNPSVMNVKNVQKIAKAILVELQKNS